jgi:predicted secreted protein
MKRLAPGEKRLLLILCGALFLAANMLGLRAFLQARSGLSKSITATRSGIAESKGWVERGEILGGATEWLDSHPMPRTAPDAASASLLKSEREEAEKSGLKVIEENLLPPQSSSQGSSVTVAVKLNGPFAGLVKFLLALQTPSAWRTVDKIEIKSDTQPPNVLVDLELRQQFHPVDNFPGSKPSQPNP